MSRGAGRYVTIKVKREMYGLLVRLKGFMEMRDEVPHSINDALEEIMRFVPKIEYSIEDVEE